MTALLAALVVLAIPFLVVTALLKLTERREDHRQLARDRQIALTDAIHWTLGAVAAPTVTRRLGGGWRVSIAVPLERPAVVAAILRVTACHFAVEETAERLEIVLTPTSSLSRPPVTLPQSAQPVATDRSLAA
jgi:hypothetical protein